MVAENNADVHGDAVNDKPADPIEDLDNLNLYPSRSECATCVASAAARPGVLTAHEEFPAEIARAIRDSLLRATDRLR
jgi:hypothetical protein